MPVSDVTLVTEDTFGVSFNKWWKNASAAEKALFTTNIKNAVAADITIDFGEYFKTWLNTASPANIAGLIAVMVSKLGMQTS